MTRNKPLLLLPAAFLALTVRANAHHSFAMYDSTKLVALEGTVTKFQWTNPHALLWVSGNTNPGEAPNLWTVELPTSPGNLTRMGWTKHSLTAGERVVIQLNPLRDGNHGGSFKKATLVASGKVLVANPVGKSADGKVSYGPNEAKPDAKALASADTQRWWSCSFQRGLGKPWLALLAGFALIAAGRRRRRSST